jgi:hypothetical protein
MIWIPNARKKNPVFFKLSGITDRNEMNLNILETSLPGNGENYRGKKFSKLLLTDHERNTDARLSRGPRLVKQTAKDQSHA